MHRSLLKLTTWLFFLFFLCFIIFCRFHGKFCFNQVVSMPDFRLFLTCDFFLKKETWNPFGQICITCILSIKGRCLKGKKKTKNKKKNTNKLHGQFSYKPNENIVTKPFYSTRLSKTFNMIFSLCVCVCVFYFVA